MACCMHYHTHTPTPTPTHTQLNLHLIQTGQNKSNLPTTNRGKNRKREQDLLCPDSCILKTVLYQSTYNAIAGGDSLGMSLNIGMMILYMDECRVSLIAGLEAIWNGCMGS